MPDFHDFNEAGDWIKRVQKAAAQAAALHKGATTINALLVRHTFNEDHQPLVDACNILTKHMSRACSDVVRVVKPT